MREAEDLDIERFQAMLEMASVLEAQEMLLQMAIAQYPMMKKDNAKAFHKKVHDKAYPRNKERRTLSTADLARISGAGIIREKK